ncbi:MAG: lipopolysaccharide core heptose(II) kinase RfaY [Aerococcus sp.]|nr:lipopolysaccharide core heptose(II) kinase RfaY [Aerococcus sp.]
MGNSNRRRFNEIIGVLGSYGFGELYGHYFNKRDEAESAKNLRLAFEQLGPSFIKIGQVLSTRSDLLPVAYIQELQKLQNSAPSFPFEWADEVFQAAFGESMHSAFQTIDETPFATGSIAQVHRATTKEGQQVIVKVQRPHIQERLIQDIDIFIRLVETIPSLLLNVMVDPVNVLRSIRQQSMLEMDFVNEANNMQRFQKNHAHRPAISVPEPVMELVSTKVLTQTYVEGFDLTDMVAVRAAGYDQKEIANKLVVSYLYQIFEDGFYHADPHPGNIMIANDKIVFIDFGMSGVVTPFYHDFLTSLLAALVQHDIDRLEKLLLLVTHQNKEIDHARLYEDLRWLYDRYLVGGFHNIDLGQITQDLLRLAWQHGLVFPDDIIDLEKTIVVLQGVVSTLDPDMDFMAIFNEYFMNRQLHHLSDTGDILHLLREGSRFYRSVTHLPSQTSELLDNLNHNRIGVSISLREAREWITELNQLINRLVSAIVLAAIIISAGLIVASTGTRDYSRLGLIFFVAGGLLALYLVFSFIRSRFK